MEKHRKGKKASTLIQWDKALDVLLQFLFVLVIPFGITMLLIGVSEHLARANPRMLSWSYTSAALLCVVPVILLGIVTCVFQRHGWLKKNPARYIGVCIAVIAVSALGACPRYEMETDHTLVCYNSFNAPVRQYDMTDYSGATVETHDYRPLRWVYKYNKWTVYVTIGTTDGRTYRFADPHRCAKLADIVRSLPPETVAVSGADRLPDVFEHYALTDAETDALLELFGIS